MCLDTQIRFVQKQGTGLPTIPASPDHRNGDWLDTDIYEGEFYQDITTGIVYTRFGGTITTVGAAAPTTLYSGDGTLSGARTVNGDNFDLLFDNMKSVGVVTNSALSTDVTLFHETGLGVSHKWFGDLSQRIYGPVGVGVDPTSAYMLHANGGSVAALRGDGSVYGGVFTGNTAGVYIVSPSGYGSQTITTDGIGTLAEASGTGFALKGSGRSFVEEYGMGAGMDAPNVFQVNSLERGARPFPVMSETERGSIDVSSSTFTFAIQDDGTNPGLYIYIPGFGWDRIARASEL